MKKLELTDSQRANIAARLNLKPNRQDLGELLPLSRKALALPARTSSEAAKRTAELARALAAERLVVPIPIESHPDSPDHEHQGLSDDDHVPLATVDHDGHQVVVGFTSAADLAQWDPLARPMVMETARVALTAGLATKTGSILVNPASEEPVYLAVPIVHALAGGDQWLAPWEDTELSEKLSTIAKGACTAVVSVRVEPADTGQKIWNGEVNVVVRVDATAGAGTDRFRDCVTAALRSLAAEPRMSVIAPKVNLVPRPVYGM